MTQPVRESQVTFDFGRHRLNAVEGYRGVRGVYDAFANVIRDILRVAIPPDCQIHSIEARAKDPDSFGNKAAQPSEQNPDIPRYPDPLQGITDLAGIRVIVFFPKTLAGVQQCIDSEFDVVEVTNKAEELHATERFGYQSIHYLVKLKASRTLLPEYKRFDSLVAEIQLRTILQHAWAEMEHDIQYKSVSSMPLSIRRRFMSLAGMLEIADREFQTIQDEDQAFREQIRDTVQQGLAGVVDLKSVVAELEARIRELQETRPAAPTYLAGSARALLDKGYYLEAVRAYDQIIEKHPSVHTNFIGRARARFLAGDSSGALSDLDAAESLYPLDPVIDRLRHQIQEAQPPISVAAAVLQQEIVRANQLLSAGDAATAHAKYLRAEELGWFEVYSRFNRAMALCLADETPEALELLDELYPATGSFMEVNAVALRALCALRAGEPHQHLLQQLGTLEGLEKFDFDKSPLRYLVAGLSVRCEDRDKYSSVLYALGQEANAFRP